MKHTWQSHLRWQSRPQRRPDAVFALGQARLNAGVPPRMSPSSCNLVKRPACLRSCPPAPQPWGRRRIARLPPRNSQEEVKKITIPRCSFAGSSVFLRFVANAVPGPSTNRIVCAKGGARAHSLLPSVQAESLAFGLQHLPGPGHFWLRLHLSPCRRFSETSPGFLGFDQGERFRDGRYFPIRQPENFPLRRVLNASKNDPKTVNSGEPCKPRVGLGGRASCPTNSCICLGVSCKGGRKRRSEGGEAIHHKSEKERDLETRRRVASRSSECNQNGGKEFRKRSRDGPTRFYG